MSLPLLSLNDASFFEYHHDSVFSDESEPPTPDGHHAPEAEGNYFAARPGAIAIPPRNRLPVIRKPDGNVWNILPSYHMFESIIGKSYELSTEDLSLPPPGYSIPPLSSSDQGRPIAREGVPPVVSERPPHLVSGSVWQSSVVGNLDNLPLVNHKGIEMEMCMVTAVNRPGTKPQTERCGDKEYTSGDTLTGYVTIKNTTAQIIPFDMFLVCLEGNIAIVKKHSPHDRMADQKPITHKLLNMVDLGASWNYEEIKQLSDFAFVQGERDPYDNTLYGLPIDRKLAPGVTYKKFFVFTLPVKLLDTACPHNKVSHCLVAPSLGINKEEFLQQIRNHRADPKGVATKPENEYLKDYCISNCSVAYSIEARCVGNVGVAAARSPFGILQHRNVYFKFTPSAAALNALFRTPKDLERVAFGELQMFFQRLDVFLSELSQPGNSPSLVMEGNNPGVVPSNSPGVVPSNSPGVVPRGNSQNVAMEGNNLGVVARGNSQHVAMEGNNLGVVPRGNRPEVVQWDTPLPSAPPIANAPTLRYAKSNQLYNPNRVKASESPFIEASFALRRKHLAGLKTMGQMTLTTVRESYSMKYIKPSSRPRARRTTSGLAASTPRAGPELFTQALSVELEFRPHQSSVRPPEFKSVAAELEVYTVSAKCPIPIELTIELLNNLEELQTTLKTYVETIRTAGGKRRLLQNLELKNDIRSLTSLYCKTNLMATFQTAVTNPSEYNNWVLRVGDNNHEPPTPPTPLPGLSGLWNAALSKGSKLHPRSPDPKAKAKPNEPLLVHKTNVIYKTRLDVSVNLKEFEPKLVPSFQACLLGRLYGIKLIVKFSYGDPVHLSIPLTIRNLELPAAVSMGGVAV